VGKKLKSGILAGVALGTHVLPAHGWWSNGHATITTGVTQSLTNTGDLGRFFSENDTWFSNIPRIEPASNHFINIDLTTLGSVNAQGNRESYGNDFTNFRAGTFTFPTTTADANARYGSAYVNSGGGVPWLANDTLSNLSTKMQAAQTYDDWINLLPTAGALAHYIEDLHQPMHLTKDYDGIPSSGLHANYEGGQFESGSANHYAELRAAITPVTPTYYGNSTGFITAVFNRIPTDYDKNVLIRNANTLALTQGTSTSKAYFDSMWSSTQTFTKDSFQEAAATIASALYTAYVNAGSPVIPHATHYGTSALENSSITKAGPVTDYTNEDFFKVNGSATSPIYGVVRFDMSNIKAEYDARYGAGRWSIDKITLGVQDAGTTLGAINVFYSPDDATNIQQGSSLLAANVGSSLGADLSGNPLLTYTTSTQPTYSISRYDLPSSGGPASLTDDILNGGIMTLLFAPSSTSTAATYYGMGGLTLDVTAHETSVPEPLAGSALIVLSLAGLTRRSSRSTSREPDPAFHPVPANQKSELLF